MSLPPAPQEISEHPHAGSVTAPIDREAQAADVDRKLHLYGVIQAFRQGRMPDNHQIEKVLNYLKGTSPVDTDKLSPNGQQLIKDFREVIETARLIILRKNGDELLQNFVWHTRDISLEGAKPGEAPSGDHTMAEDRHAAVQHLRTLLTLILTNSEVRKLLADFSVIGRDLLAKGVVKAAEAIKPGEEELAHVDEAAAEGEFVTKGGAKTGTDETPILDVPIPRTNIRLEQHPRAAEPKVRTGEGEEIPGSRAVSKGKEAAQDVQDRAVDISEQAVDEAQQVGQQPSTSEGTSSARTTQRETEEKKRDIMGRVKDKIAETLPQSKQRASEHARKGRQFLVEEYFPEERRDQFIYRGKKVIIECQKHSDYQDAIKWLLSVAAEYAERGQEAREKGKESAESVIKDPTLRNAISELRELLERFANKKSMHIILDSIGALSDDARRDEEFRNWFKRVDAFVHKLLLEAGYVLEDECTREGKDIRESGRKFWDQKYKSHFDNVFNSIGDWFSAMGEDPLNKQFGEDWARLTRDLLFDSEGGLKFKTELWSDIRDIIVPALVDKIGYLPIPRIEYSDDSLDLVLENLTLQGQNLFPNIVTFVAHNYLKFSPYKKIPDEHHHEFTFTFSQMQADMRDIAFFFRKKTGFPKVADSGMADVVIGGSGLTAVIHLVSAGKDRSSVFKVKDVHVKVGSLKFSIRDSKHDLLYRTMKPLATGLVKRQIKKALADAIRTGMEYVDGQLVSVRDRVEEARSPDEANRTHVLQNLFMRHKEGHKEKEQTIHSSESRSQFKIVSTKRSSMIDTGHPSGWVSRISESEEKAVAGPDWHSKVFNLE